MKLHLGVFVQGYKERGTTTADVADILEAKYGVMEHFWGKYGQRIADDVVGNLNEFIGGINNPHAKGTKIFNDSMSQTEKRFKYFLSSKEAERVGIPGTPTKAALKGVDHRLAHPYAKSNPRRPSFIDSSIYQENFKAWISGWGT